MFKITHTHLLWSQLSELSYNIYSDMLVLFLAIQGFLWAASGDWGKSYIYGGNKKCSYVYFVNVTVNGQIVWKNVL